ncbi:MAG: VanZ family protein [Bacteroidetes bacterium]|nr:VanZ family protein [Bacteroidota bacterium]
MLRLITAIKPYSKLLFIAWMAIILTVSSIPSLPTLKIETEKTTIRLDYLIHFCEYGVLAFLACLAYTNNQLRISFKRIVILASGLIIFAAADEFHQKFIPGRAFNLKDIYSNIAGIIAALIFCWVVFRILLRNRG